MSVVPLNASTAARLAELQCEPEPSHISLSPAARNAMTSLEGKVGALRRIFAGPSTTRAMAGEIERLTNDIRTEAQRIARFSR